MKHIRQLSILVTHRVQVKQPGAEWVTTWGSDEGPAQRYAAMIKAAQPMSEVRIIEVDPPVPTTIALPEGRSTTWWAALREWVTAAKDLPIDNT